MNSYYSMVLNSKNSMCDITLNFEHENRCFDLRLHKFHSLAGRIRVCRCRSRVRSRVTAVTILSPGGFMNSWPWLAAVPHCQYVGGCTDVRNDLIMVTAHVFINTGKMYKC